jgi:Spy/CpxP family protein refolding chaperone
MPVLRKLQRTLLLMSASNSPLSTGTLFVSALLWQRISKECFKMKKLFCATALMFALASGTQLVAQQAGPEGGHRDGGGMMMSTDQRLQRMTRQLDLTTDQQAKIRPLLEDESTKMQALHQNSSLSPQDMHTQMQQIRQNTNSQVMSILTDTQQQKWQQMMQERHGAPRGNGQMSPPPQGTKPPPPQQQQQ